MIKLAQASIVAIVSLLSRFSIQKTLAQLMRILILFCLLLSLPQIAISKETDCTNGIADSSSMEMTECGSHSLIECDNCEACFNSITVGTSLHQTIYTSRPYVLAYQQLSQFVPDATIPIPYKPPKHV